MIRVLLVYMHHLVGQIHHHTNILNRAKTHSRITSRTTRPPMKTMAVYIFSRAYPTRHSTFPRSPLEATRKFKSFLVTFNYLHSNSSLIYLLFPYLFTFYFFACPLSISLFILSLTLPLNMVRPCLFHTPIKAVRGLSKTLHN
jgi:hypothetical protein